MTQEIKGKQIVPTPWTRVFWIAVGLAITGFFGWTGKTLIDVHEHLIYHEALEVRVSSLERFANSGPRFTREDGERLSDRLATHSHPVTDEQISHLREDLAELKVLLQRIEGKLDRLR